MCCICFGGLGIMVRENQIKTKAIAKPSASARPTKNQTQNEAISSKQAKGKQVV